MGGPRGHGKGALTRVGNESRGEKGHVGRSVLGWREALAAKAHVHIHVCPTGSLPCTEPSRRAVRMLPGAPH